MNSATMAASHKIWHLGDDVDTDALAPAGSAFSGMERMVLDRYSLERRP